MLLIVLLSTFVLVSCRPGVVQVRDEREDCKPGWEFIAGRCVDVYDPRYTVLPRCPENYEWYDGKCRNPDVSGITVQPVCLPPYTWHKGACRDVSTFNRNVVTVPPNCPPEQEWVNGACRDVWRGKVAPTDTRPRFDSKLSVAVKNPSNTQQDNRNVISVPNQCPSGYRPDALGNCRPLFPTSNSG